eukprot:scaffold7329_cov222-Pinguiococcus_pyrenoidosus.AAC.11
MRKTGGWRAEARAKNALDGADLPKRDTLHESSGFFIDSLWAASADAVCSQLSDPDDFRLTIFSRAILPIFGSARLAALT